MCTLESLEIVWPKSGSINRAGFLQRIPHSDARPSRIGEGDEGTQHWECLKAPPTLTFEEHQ